MAHTAATSATACGQARNRHAGCVYVIALKCTRGGLAWKGSKMKRLLLLALRLHIVTWRRKVMLLEAQ